MHPLHRVRIGALSIAATVVTASSLFGCGGDHDPDSRDASTSSTSATEASAADRFLRDYVTEDGRVLRHDQGGDVVSEGQAYAMLIAQSAGRGPPQYGPDAQRLPLWFATCTGEPHQLAGGWWAQLQQDDRSMASALTTDGQLTDGSPSTVALLASAASAQAAGDAAGSTQLRHGAEQTEQCRPSYYGAAWLALSQVFPPDGEHDC